MTAGAPGPRPGLARNAGFGVAARLADIAGSAVLLILAARYFGAEEFGVYGFVQGIALFLTPIFDWGVQRILIRDLAVDKEGAGQALAAGLVVILIVVALASAGLALVQRAVGLVTPGQTTALTLAVAAQALLCLTRCLSSVFIAFERMLYETLTSLVSRTLAVVCCVLVVLAGGGLTAFFAAIFTASAGSLGLAAYLAATRFVRPGPWAGWGRVRLLLRDANALALSAFLNQGAGEIAIFPLKFLRGPLDVSFFLAGKRIVDAAMVVTRALIIAMSPGLSRLGDNPDHAPELRRQIVASSRLAVMLMAPAALSVALLATDVATLLLGKDFAPVGASLPVLAWLLPAFFINALMETALTALRQPRALIFTHAAGFAWATLAGILAVKGWGFVGAAWSMVTAAVLVCGLNVSLTARLIGLPGLTCALAGPLAASAGLFVGLRLALPDAAPLAVVALALLSCLPVMLALRIVRFSELAALAALLRRGRPA